MKGTYTLVNDKYIEMRCNHFHNKYTLSHGTITEETLTREVKFEVEINDEGNAHTKWCIYGYNSAYLMSNEVLKAQ